MRHVIETSGRMVPALDFDAPAAVSSLAHPIVGLGLGLSACGQPTVSRIHPVDGKPEGFGVFASPELAAHFMKTFGGACGHVTTDGGKE